MALPTQRETYVWKGVIPCWYGSILTGESATDAFSSFAGTGVVGRVGGQLPVLLRRIRRLRKLTTFSD
jgi:hypothetical protein